METSDFKFIKPGEIRTRIAPAPTGFLHIGTARTALFNYLFAKKNQGVFILRIEDTDIERCKTEYEKDIMESLKWLGIEWDEGPTENKKYIRDYGPYRQSERSEIYRKYLEKLLDEGMAYRCFCSKEELEAQRQYQMSIGEPPRYSGKCSQLSSEEIKKYLAERKKSVIRFKMPSKKVVFEDMIRGRVEFDSGLIGNIVIAKDLFTPLYNFACVIDDFEMKVSHVIRGEDHLPNTPKQILIQKALGFPQPKYAHLPLILGPDRTKLSKRHGAVAIAEFKKAGYLPEALINFMAFLGWNPGGKREIYSPASLIKEFSMERVQKGGAVFNTKRLDFLNGFYIRQRSIEKLTELCLPYLIEARLIEELEQSPGDRKILGFFKTKGKKFKIKETGEIIDLDYLKKIVSIYQERLKKLSEISELTDFFFKEKLGYDKNLLKWTLPFRHPLTEQTPEMINKEVRVCLDRLRKILSKIRGGNWNKENLERFLMPEAVKIGDKGKILWPFRVALTGKEASAGPFEIAEILGREKVLKRIKEARELVK
ncbi:glutamate--tRNA ligase [Patescibacteria group bacterium]|nr:glutamate--tRNA ligase [Patescibacteria group bacterium]